MTCLEWRLNAAGMAIVPDRSKEMSSQNDTVTLKIMRYNPQADKAPHQEVYTVPVGKEKMNLLQALEYIYRNQDDSLAFRRYSCGIQFCNSCLMMINGKQSHACLTILRPGEEFEVSPLRGKEVCRDLIVSDEE